MNKKITVEVPDSVGPETAQTCLLLGMKIYASCYNGGLCVAHGVEDQEKGLRLRLAAFRGEYAAAFYRFLKAIDELKNRKEGRPEDIVTENLEGMRDEGKKIIHDLQYGGKDGAAR